MVNPITIEVPHENRTKYGLTGNTRVRIHTVNKFFGSTSHLVVLQVEEKWQDGPSDYHGLPIYLAGTRWRDAVPEDLINI